MSHTRAPPPHIHNDAHTPKQSHTDTDTDTYELFTRANSSAHPYPPARNNGIEIQHHQPVLTLKLADYPHPWIVCELWNRNTAPPTKCRPQTRRITTAVHTHAHTTSPSPPPTHIHGNTETQHHQPVLTLKLEDYPHSCTKMHTRHHPYTHMYP